MPESGPAAIDRTATFVGSMPAIAGTKRMWMRFDLFARVAPSTGFAAVKAPKLGVWQKSAPGRVSSGFVFAKDVHGLTAPGQYRAVVRFRWYASDGAVAEMRRTAQLQAARPASRPRRRAGAGRARRGPGHVPLAVRNTGRTAAPFAVALTVGGAPAASTWPGSRPRPPRR